VDGAQSWTPLARSSRAGDLRLPSLIFLNHFVFAAAILGLSIVLVIGVMMTLFFRHLSIPDASEKAPAYSRESLRTGGIAIAGAFLIGILLVHTIGEFTPIKSRYFWGFSVSLLLITSTSLYSTFRSLGIREKLGWQALAAAIVMCSGIVIDEIHVPWLGWVAGGWWEYPLTFAWILGLTNIYERMDEVDGLAASNAVIASAFFSYIAFHHESVFIYLCSVALFAASFGFLVFNWPPAKIFMGDIGSAFLGFSFAVMAIIAALYDRSHTSLLVIPLLLFHFVFDAVLTFVTRTLRANNLPDWRKLHLYELLIQLKYPHRRIILIYTAMGVSQGFGAILMTNIEGSYRILVFLPFLVFQMAYAYWLVSAAKAANPDWTSTITAE